MIVERTRPMWAVFDVDGELFALFASEEPARSIAHAEDGDRLVEAAVTYVYDDGEPA